MAVLLSLSWIAIGYFPAVNIEGDSALFSAGCERLAANSLQLPPDYFYMWDMQPLVGFMVAALKHVVPVCSCEHLYVILSLIAAILYLFAASMFLSKLCALRWEYCYFVLLLFPESYSIGYYPNTTIFASLMFITGLNCMLNKPFSFCSMISLALAPLLRIDILLLYPLVFLLLWYSYNIRTAIKYSVIYAVSLCAILLFGFWLLRTNPLLTWSQYSTLAGLRASQFSVESFVRINISYYSVISIVLIVTGTTLLVKQHSFRLLMIAFFPIAAFYIINRDFTGAGAKHLQYILPFLSFLCLVAVKHLLIHRKTVKRYVFALLGLLILSQAVLGVRFYPASKPWVSDCSSQIHPRPTIASLLSFPVGRFGRIELALGAGMVIPTADELMLVSGYLYTPLYWHSVKTEVSEERDAVRDIILSSVTNDTLYVMTTVGSDWALSQQLHGLGYEIESLDQGGINPSFDSRYWYRFGDQRILVTCITTERSVESFNAAYDLIGHRPLYVIVEYDWQRYYVNERLTDAIPLSTNVSIVY